LKRCSFFVVREANGCCVDLSISNNRLIHQSLFDNKYFNPDKYISRMENN